MREIYYLLILVTVIHLGCNLTKWDLDQDGVANFSITIDTLELNPNMESNIIAIADDEFLIAIQKQNSNIELLEISQSFDNDDWTLTEEIVQEVGIGELKFFDTIENGFLLGILNLAGDFSLIMIDDNYEVINQNESFETFIDTSYNDIDSLIIKNFSYNDATDEIILCGQVSTQGTIFSCILSLDENLNPLYFKTYFENSLISDLVSFNDSTYFLVNNGSEGTDLIRDNENSSAYKKYDLSSDQLFINTEAIFSDDKIYLSGIQNDIGRLIEVDIENSSAFINEVEIYPVVDFKAFQFSSNNIVATGIQTDSGRNNLFSSELESFGSIWCNRYPNEEYFKILDVIGLPEKGILISTIVERAGEYFLHLTRVDNEGATFTNEYSENCI